MGMRRQEIVRLAFRKLDKDNSGAVFSASLLVGSAAAAAAAAVSVVSFKIAVAASVDVAVPPPLMRLCHRVALHSTGFHSYQTFLSHLRRRHVTGVGK